MNTAKSAFKLAMTSAAAAALILDSKNCLDYALEGINLCLRSVTPALFPFVILSIYLVGNLPSGSVLFLDAVGKLCKIPPGAESILLTGLVGGYPVGAQAVAQAWRSGDLSREDAHRMLGFCSNAGPAFIFGILGPMFSNSAAVWLLWAIHILSAILTGTLLPSTSISRKNHHHRNQITFTSALERALRVMAVICGWVIVFRIITGMAQRWLLWLLPEYISILITGLLEMTNGCLFLSRIGQEELRFLLASVLLALGGLCVGMQTLSVTGNLGTGLYFPGKVLQTCISISLSALVLPFLYAGAKTTILLCFGLLISAFIAASLHIWKNNSSNLYLHRV